MRHIALFCLALLCGSFSAAQQLDPASVELSKTVPIADVHMHTYSRGGLSSETAVTRMRNNNVRWGGGVGDLRPDIVEAIGSGHIAAAGQLEFSMSFFRLGPSSLESAENPYFRELLLSAEQMFKQGKIKGFGELHTNNESSGPRPFRRKIKTDNPLMRSLFQIANGYGGFIQIHSQHHPEFNQDILRLSRDYPNTTTILSHCLPLAQPEDLSELFDQRNNIMCELSATGDLHNRLARLNRGGRVYGENGLKPKWKKLIETYPDRFMLGTDTCCGWDAHYDEAIHEIRNNFLPYLPAEIIEKIAYKNALRVFNLPE